jgi:hypothetical protein
MHREMKIAIRDEDADPERLDELSSALPRELLDLGVDDVDRVREGEAPPGTRALDVAAIGVLLVAFQESLPVISGIVGVVRAWLASARGARAVELTIGDQTLRVDSASQEQQERLIDEFVAALHRSEELATPASSPGS